MKFILAWSVFLLVCGSAHADGADNIPSPCKLVSKEDVIALHAGRAQPEESTYVSRNAGHPVGRSCSYRLRSEGRGGFYLIFDVSIEPDAEAQSHFEEAKRVPKVWEKGNKVLAAEDGLCISSAIGGLGSYAHCIGVVENFLVIVYGGNPLADGADGPSTLLDVLRRVLSKIPRSGG
jgi:hypothetical protein